MAPKVKSLNKKHTPSSQSSPSSAPAPRVVTPNWPLLQPLVPSTDVSINTVLEGQILTIPQLWTSTLCKSYVGFLSTLPLVTTPGKPKKGNAVRVNDRFQVEDCRFAEQLWSSTALRQLIMNTCLDGVALDEDAKRELWGGDVLGLNGNIRIYRYTKGQFFDQHYDEANNITFPYGESADPVKAKTTWTLLLYLTSPTTGCTGGETVFYPEPQNKREATPAPIIVELDAGMALLHRHGQDCLLHEGREVTAGEKWVIRSDLCVKR